MGIICGIIHSFHSVHHPVFPVHTNMMFHGQNWTLCSDKRVRDIYSARPNRKATLNPSACPEVADGSPRTNILKDLQTVLSTMAVRLYL